MQLAGLPTKGQGGLGLPPAPLLGLVWHRWYQGESWVQRGSRYGCLLSAAGHEGACIFSVSALCTTQGLFQWALRKSIPGCASAFRLKDSL